MIKMCVFLHAQHYFSTKKYIQHAFGIIIITIDNNGITNISNARKIVDVIEIACDIDYEIVPRAS